MHHGLALLMTGFKVQQSSGDGGLNVPISYGSDKRFRT